MIDFFTNGGMNMTSEFVEVITEPVDKNGQVTIPAEIREKLNLKQGNILLFELTKNGECYFKKINKLRYFFLQIKKLVFRRFNK